MTHRAEYRKPDGRRIWLYGRNAITVAGSIPSPSPESIVARTHLRWHPVLEEWVIYASHRQDRTFLPPAESDPLAPAIDPDHPTELPVGNYEVAVFENRFPSLLAEPGPAAPVDGATVAPAVGACEVVVFDQDAALSLGELPLDRICLIFEVWADRTRALQGMGMPYVLPFENRGAEIGVTLLHPHGQIYAYGFLPRRQASAMQALRRHRERTGRDLVADLAAEELRHQLRVVAARGHIVGFAPPFGRFPDEVWIAPTRQVPDLAGLTPEERADMAFVLSQILRRLDALWSRPMPYLMTVNQAPTDGGPHPEWTVWIEINPIRRAPDKLKFLAGTELGAGIFANDILPEAAAARLRDIIL
jgi:UDPglucose--hexose-1-phosphate uridylyltransferase